MTASSSSRNSLTIYLDKEDHIMGLGYLLASIDKRAFFSKKHRIDQQIKACGVPLEDVNQREEFIFRLVSTQPKIFLRRYIGHHHFTRQVYVASIFTLFLWALMSLVYGEWISCVYLLLYIVLGYRRLKETKQAQKDGNVNFDRYHHGRVLPFFTKLPFVSAFPYLIPMVYEFAAVLLVAWALSFFKTGLDTLILLCGIGMLISNILDLRWRYKNEQEINNSILDTEQKSTLDVNARKNRRKSVYQQALDKIN